jgi:phosphatidylserine decarboxylase
VYNDPTVFYSPADGIILYAHEEVRPTEPIVEIKGRNFTVRDILADHRYEYPSIVIGIFMTQYDVHVNRVPTRGFLNQCRSTPYLHTPNVSMVLEEQDILEGHPEQADMGYLFQNEKCVSQVYCPDIRGCYYIIQIAEKDVNVIQNWGEGEFFQQGDRYGQVRWGSQVDLVIPLMERVQYEVLAQERTHVEGGVDALIKIHPSKQWTKPT